MRKNFHWLLVGAAVMLMAGLFALPAFAQEDSFPVGVEVLAASRVVAPHPASSRVAVITPAAILVRRLIIVSCGLVSVP